MELYTVVSIAIVIFAAGVFIGIISYACGQRMIIKRCNIIVGPDVDAIKKMAKQLKVYANPSRMTLRRGEKKQANVVSLNNRR